jgi:2-oxoglutarate dehydrogenase E2 component (dihydrolipoamide succinyltransferase)
MIVEIKIPSPGESISEVTLSSWLKVDGDHVERNDELFEIESDKATLSISAAASGVLSIKIASGEICPVGAIAGTIDDSAAPPVKKETSVKSADGNIVTPTLESATSSYTKGLPSLVAQKLMTEQKIAPEAIHGTGKGGRITTADVVTFQAPAPVEVTPSLSSKVFIPPVSNRNTHRQKLSLLRMKVADRLVAAKNQTAMLTTFNELDMTRIMELRARYKEKFKEQHSVGLGFMSFFTKAVTEALRSYPAINAMIDGDEMVFHDFVDMGIAVQAPRGLVVPVIRNADALSFSEIEAEIERLAFRARNNQLTVDEMTGGTFTISNGGVFGSLMSTPLLNPPQSGILGMHNIVRRPVAIGDQVEIRPMMYLAFSYDHRIIDGRESVGFLVRVKELLEDPIRFLLKV